MKHFNTTGVCVPEIHYMVDISDRIRQISDMVDAGQYFTINRARQYGKTTTLSILRKHLLGRYLAISLDFQGISSKGFSSEEDFVQDFCRLLRRSKRTGVTFPAEIDVIIDDIIGRSEHKAGFGELFDMIADWCDIAPAKIVLMIDEVDSASNNQVFLDFLAQLRDSYLKRNSEGYPAFQSVILAGVTDVKHLKSKIREDGHQKVNSPWNIAADFLVNMSFSRRDIKGMLDEYEAEHKTGMNTDDIASCIEAYTAGYPYLVSRICQLIDERLMSRNPDQKTSTLPWSRQSVDEAVKWIVSEENTLFDSIMGKLTNYPGLKRQLYRIIMLGETVEYIPDDEAQKQLRMYGFLDKKDNSVIISNRIFETRLYNHFLGEKQEDDTIRQIGAYDKNLFVADGRLNVPLILKRFIESYHQIFGPLTDRFPEKDGRELFLLYLKPIINGTGNYYIEAQTRTQTRMDIVIDYLGQQYIIEVKIWRGPRYNADGEKQLMEYMEYFCLDTGYMLSFNFNKKKEIGVKRVILGEKVLFEGTV